MWPILLHLGPVTVYTYPVVLVAAFFLVGYVFWRKGREEHFPEDELLDSFLLASIAGVSVSRLAYIGLHFARFGLDGRKWLNFLSYPGMVPLAGLVAAAYVLYRFGQQHKWDVFEILDFAAIATAFGLAITWLGLFLDGTSFGYPTAMPWGMLFPLVFERRQPTQVFGLVLYAFLFWYLYRVEGKYRTFEWYRDKRHSAQTGFLFCVFCMAYGLFGIVLGVLMPPQLVVFGVGLDVPLRIMILLYGCILLFVRAGRSFRPVKK